MKTGLAHPVALIEDKTTAIIDELIDSLPDPKQLTSEERRGIIARYASVLEGNFIYWMTAAVLAALAVHDDLTKVRLFMGRLSPVKSVLTMGFFEGFIQRFMSFLACLAAEQGSAEREYTDVHGVCDIEHTEGLFRVLAAELAIAL